MTDKAEDRGDAIADGDESGDTLDPAVKADEKDEVAEKEATEKEAAEKEAAEKVEAEEAAKAKADDKEPKIPKSRFDEAVRKARLEAESANKKAADLEARLRQSQGAVDAAKLEEEIDALEVELDGAKADGNVDKAKAIRAQIRARQQAISDARSDAKANYAVAVAVEQIRYDALVSRMEIEHPELNPELEDTYDKDQVEELLDLKGAFEAKGLGSAEALTKALRTVYRGGPKPAVKEEDAEAKIKADAAAAARKAEAVKRGLDTKAKQPADGKKVGADSDKAGKGDPASDAAKMSEAAFAKLTPEELARARGDIL